MMTKFFGIMTLFLTITFISNAQLRFNEWENRKFSNLKIKCIENSITFLKIQNVDYEYGAPMNVGFWLYDLKYDKNFNLIESKFYDEDDYEGKKTIEYNSNNDTLIIQYLDDEGEKEERFEFKYDSKNNLVEKKLLEEGELQWIETFIYDSKNQLIEKKRLNSGELDFQDFYKYDPKGREIEWIHFNEDSLEEYKSVSTYNVMGLKSDSTVYFEGELDATFEYTYDGQSNLTEWKVSSPLPEVGLIERVTFEYDIHNRIVEQRIHDDQNVMVQMYLATYDDDTGELKKLAVHEEGEFLVGTWTYDYFENGLLRFELYYNKVDVEQFTNRFYYTPKQRSDY